MVFGITRGKEAWLKSYKLLVEMLHEIGVLKLATRKICYQFLKKKRGLMPPAPNQQSDTLL